MGEKERGRRRKAEEKPEDFFDLTRRVLLAGVGAVALAHDEVHAFLDRLVERGELAQKQARDLLKEVSEKREGRLQKARTRLRERLGDLLEALDVPRRSDLEALERRLAHLTAQVEALLKEKEG
jgi:poly(hydroxyalkanoate) granule-associated protein